MSDIPARVREVMQAVGNMHVLATVDAEGRPQMRWMGALVEDPDQAWTFYLACGKESRKMKQIAGNPHAQLIFSKQDDWQVATLSGTAEAVDCVHCRKLLWDGVPAMGNYYSGPDDPNMGIIRFTTKCLELLAMSEGHETHCFEL
jgi:general stress protein 26